MRIVHFDEIFHPEYGYQINILPKYQVEQGHEVYIVTGKNNLLYPAFKGFTDNKDMDEKDRCFEERTGVKIIRIEIYKFIYSQSIFKCGFKKKIDNLDPDILFCHFNDTVTSIYYTLIHRNLKYPIIFDSHMLEMASVNRFSKAFRFFYRTLIAPIIKKNNLKVIRTQDDDYVEKRLGIPLSQAPFISFGTDLSLFKPNQEQRMNFRSENNIKNDDFVIVYTGKLGAGKDGKLLANAMKEKFDNVKDKNVVIIVVGNTTGDYGEEVEKIFSQSENRIIRFPTQKYMELPKFYQVADLSVFSKQCSLSFYDVQACGLPVVSENNNINIDRLSHNNGFTFNAGDVMDFRNKIKCCIEMDESRYFKMKMNSLNFIKENYNYKDIAEEYTSVLKNAYEVFHNKKNS